MHSHLHTRCSQGVPQITQAVDELPDVYVLICCTLQMKWINTTMNATFQFSPLTKRSILERVYPASISVSPKQLSNPISNLASIAPTLKWISPASASNWTQCDAPSVVGSNKC